MVIGDSCAKVGRKCRGGDERSSRGVLARSAGVVRVVVPGRPVAGNRTLRWARGVVYRDPRYRAYVELVAAYARQAMRGRAPLRGEVTVGIRAVFTDRRSLPDADAIPKAVLDGLTGVVWLDDRQVCRLGVCREVTGEEPRVEVVVRPA